MKLIALVITMILGNLVHAGDCTFRFDNDSYAKYGEGEVIVEFLEQEKGYVYDSASNFVVSYDYVDSKKAFPYVKLGQVYNFVAFGMTKNKIFYQIEYKEEV